MTRESAGVLLYRVRAGTLEVLLVHPGGPYFRTKDDGWWTIPKGEVEPGEERLAAARRELAEETGLAPEGPFLALTPVRQKGGKVVHAWACAGDCDAAALASGTFEQEWPPRSGRRVAFPEVDRAQWFSPDEARRKANAAQAAWIDELEALLGTP